MNTDSESLNADKCRMVSTSLHPRTQRVAGRGSCVLEVVVIYVFMKCSDGDRRCFDSCVVENVAL